MYIHKILSVTVKYVSGKHNLNRRLKKNVYEAKKVVRVKNIYRLCIYMCIFMNGNTKWAQCALSRFCIP